MRLIEADELMDFISEHAEQIQYAIEHKDMEILESLIKQIPTAYNVDKVLEQLEYSRVPNTGIAGYHKVVEIVKGGGTRTSYFFNAGYG